MASQLVLLSALAAQAIAQITPAAQLLPRATDPALVGYISSSGALTDVRSCDYPQTVSTSGSYVQCCPTAGPCPFYTTCSSNTLLASGTSVPCDVNPGLACNTGIVKPSADAQGGPSYVACWQTSLGTSPFTFVQDAGSATEGSGGSSTSDTGATTSGSGSTTASTATSSGTASSTGSSSSSRATAAGSSSSSTASSSSSSAIAPIGAAVGAGGGLAGLMAMLAQILL